MTRRIAGLAAALAAGAALVAGAAQVAPVPVGAADGPLVPAAATRAELVCPGPETALAPEDAEAVPAPAPARLTVARARPADADGREQGGDTAILPLAVDGSSAGAAAPQEPVDAPAGEAALSSEPLPVPAVAPGGHAVVTVRAGAGGGALVEAGPDGPVPASVAALQTTVVPDGDLRGLSATACRPALATSWLVGGGTRLGRRARLLLANPGTAPAVVDLTVLTGSGPVRPPAGQGLAVAPGAQRAVLVDALVPDQDLLTVQVAASGSPVVATLHDSVLRGLVSGGADDVVPSAPPAETQIVPGVVIPDDLGFPGPPGPYGPAVRVAVPGESNAVVRVALHGPGGPVDLPDGAGVVTVAAGSVADVALHGVPAGTYTAVVESETDVVAGAVSAGQGGEAEPTEIAWVAAAQPLTRPVLVPVPAAPVAATLVLSGVAGAPSFHVRVQELSADGARLPGRTVQVPAGRTVQVDPERPGPGALLVQPTGAVGALVLRAPLDDAPGPPGLAVVTLEPGPAQAPAVRARPEPAAGLLRPGDGR